MKHVTNLTRYLSAVVGLFFFAFQADAQFAFERDQSVKVFVGGAQLPNAWAGGLTAAQTSYIDVNFDGKKDLFLFDRDGNRSMVFINEDDASGQMVYRFAPEYAAGFPQLRDWALLRDFDGDGKEDIFTGWQSSIRVWRNTSTPENGVSFELHTPQLQCSFDFGNGPSIFPLVCLSIDLPSIVDYDGDGDLDIVSFTESATTLYFFTNMAVENGQPGALEYVCTNRCYGMAAEGAEDNSVFYGDDFVCPFNVANPRGKESEELDWVSGGPRHAGGTLVSIDLDGNGILDLVVGDSGYSTLQAWLMEDAVDGQDSTAFVDLTFPSLIAGTEPVDVYRFPGSFYVDVNNDGLNDLIISPNSRFQANDSEGMWLYLNSGSNDAPQFDLLKTNFLQDEMIEVGSGAYPVLFDLTGNGLSDLVLANREYYIDAVTRRSQIALFENTGTPDVPEFVLIDDNWLDIPSFGWSAPYPTFGDLDGDGKADMVIGEDSGEIHFFKNVAEVGEPAHYEPFMLSMTDVAGSIIDIGQFSTPQLFDVDGDGLLDLLIGEKLGIVNYYRNVGTANDFAFERVLGEAGEALGGVTVNTFLGINGYSVPQMYRGDDGELTLFVANETGTIEVYDGISGNLDGLFNQVTDKLANLQEGYRCAMWVADVTNDGYPELFYGIANGGLMYFKGVDSTVAVQKEKAPVGSIVFPNPTSAAVEVQFDQLFTGMLTVYDLRGKIVLTQHVVASHRQVVNLEHLPQGTYLLEFIDSKRREVHTLIKQ